MPNAKKTSYINIHSENYIVIIPLSILALFAIFLGFVASDLVGVGSDFLGNSLFYHPSHLLIIEAEFSLPLYVKLMATVLSLIGAFLAFYLYHYGHYFLSGLTFPYLLHFNQTTLTTNKIPNNEAGCEKIENLTLQNYTDTTYTIQNSILKEKEINYTTAKFKVRKNYQGFMIVNTKGLVTLIVRSYTFLNGKYLLDNLFNNYLISGGLKLGYLISKLLDKGIIELIGPFGLTEGSYSASSNLTKLDTGVITTYALYITLGLISILFILFSPLF